MSDILTAAVELEIPAPAQEAFALMCDFADYPRWQTAVSQANVLKKTERGSIVEFKVDLIVRKLRYVLDYHVQPESYLLEWNYLEGDIMNVGGEFRLDVIDEKNCLAFYRLVAHPGFYVPSPLVFLVKNTVMVGVLRDLRKEVSKKRQPFAKP